MVYKGTNNTPQEILVYNELCTSYILAYELNITPKEYMEANEEQKIWYNALATIYFKQEDKISKKLKKLK